MHMLGAHSTYPCLLLPSLASHFAAVLLLLAHQLIPARQSVRAGEISERCTAVNLRLTTLID